MQEVPSSHSAPPPSSSFARLPASQPYHHHQPQSQPLPQPLSQTPPSPSVHTLPSLSPLTAHASPLTAHASPLTAHASPSTLQPSPLSISRPLAAANGSAEGRGGTSNGTNSKKVDPNRTRSAVACAHCRKSKVRCQTSDDHMAERHQPELPSIPKCDQCLKSSRTCSYTTEPAASNGAVRRRSSISAGHDGDKPSEASRKRSKKHAPVLAPKEKTSSTEDLLNPNLITPSLLTELWNIFEQQFLTDLPFLHKINFTKKLRQFHSSYPVDDSFTCLLLAFLALTTPLSETFVQESWPKFCGSCAATTATDISKKYAVASHAMLNSTGALASPTLETTQTLLMIGLHEWRVTMGRKAFLTIGMAVNSAVLLRCARQEDLDPRKTLLPFDSRPAKPMTPEERFIEAETKRRTFWSCYILDSYVSSGRDRPWRVRDDDTKQVQLPCSEKAFTFGQNVRTLKLNETEAEFRDRRDQHLRSSQPCLANGFNRMPAADGGEIMWEGENNLESLAWFIRALDVYRGVVEWTCNVTRRNDPKAPWDEDSTFYKLDTRIDELKRRLPMDLVLDPSRTIGQIGSGTHRNYVLLHSVFAICDMALHREYIPLYPCGAPYPQGPVDGDNDHLQNPKDERWWRTDAEKCFKAARGYLDLMDTCADNHVLVETPMTGFALFYVLQIILWCRLFPNMDEQSHLCAKGDEKVLVNHFHRAWKLMTGIQHKLPMAQYWTAHLWDYWELLKKGKRSWRITAESPQSDKSHSSTGSTESRGVNGLEDWVPVEPYLKEFGNHQQDTTHVKAVQDIDITSEGGGDGESGSPSVRGEDGDTIASTPQSSAFKPINAVKIEEPVKSENRPTPNYGSPAYTDSTQWTPLVPHSYGGTVPQHHWQHADQAATYQPVGMAQAHDQFEPSDRNAWGQRFGTFVFNNQSSIENFGGGNEDVISEGPLESQYIPPYYDMSQYQQPTSNYYGQNNGNYNQHHAQ